ncbi:hypothetical protein [Flavobacterium ginsengisoli]|uniref:hypothetical protein n=1 Tax=Flavobacterium ginsengisoli TaxID=871694 RepID=UPI0024155C61|nr:hypothetical protein [Flavobacterium ginsengisoli]
MIEKVLKNLIYIFYPRNISFEREQEKYFVSDQYRRLNQTLKTFESDFKEVCSKNILEQFEDDYTLKNFQDHTLFEFGDKCLTFNFGIIEDGELYTVSLLISVLAPYYIIKCQKNIIELVFSKDRIAELEATNFEQRKLKEIILKLENIVEEKLYYNKFPDKMLNYVMEDISFQEADFGYFNMFNAFFNNLIMRENEK